MAEIDVSVERYQGYRQSGESKYGVDVVNGAILYDLLEKTGGSTDGGSSSTTRPTAHFENVGIGSGTIPDGARYASFSISNGGTGTIQGTAYDGTELTEVYFPELSSGYDEISYEVTAGNLAITYAV